MNYTRQRVPSPENRHFIDPMRASTGSMTLESELDPYYPLSGASYDGYQLPSVAGDHIHDLPPRSYYESRHRPSRPVDDYLVEEQLTSSKMYRSTSQPKTPREEDTTRPRSKTSSVASSARRPLSVIIPSSNRQYHVVSGYESARSPHYPSYYYDDLDGYMSPASSSHARRGRILSSDEGDDRLASDSQKTPTQIEYGAYPSSGGGRRTSYYPSSAGLKSQDVEFYDSYSYTNPTEQFYRDYPDTRQDSRRETYGREESMSLAGLHKYLPSTRKEPRDSGYPPSRGYDKIERDENRRRASRDFDGSDISRLSDSSRRRSHRLPPVSLHQERAVEPAYRGGYDDRDHRQHRHRYEDASIGDDHAYRSNAVEERYESNPRSEVGAKLSRTKPITTGGLATEGLASGYSKSIEYDSGIDPKTDVRKIRERDRSTDASHRAGRPRKPRSESDSDEKPSGEDSRTYGNRNGDGARRDQSEASADLRRDRRIRDPEQVNNDSWNADRPLRLPPDKVHSDEKTLAPMPIESPDDRRRVLMSGTTTSKQPEIKSILKTPKEKFPEDPNVLREGVAPLKDASKKGIPPGARWTKIDRRLVSPAALEGLERFEERQDYVIVLRVLTKEEIQAYAIKTVEIRALRRRKDKDEDRRYDRRNYNRTSDEEGAETPVATEPTPDSRRQSSAAMKPR